MQHSSYKNLHKPWREVFSFEGDVSMQYGGYAVISPSHFVKIWCLMIGIKCWECHKAKRQLCVLVVLSVAATLCLELCNRIIVICKYCTIWQVQFHGHLALLIIWRKKQVGRSKPAMQSHIIYLAEITHMWWEFQNTVVSELYQPATKSPSNLIPRWAYEKFLPFWIYSIWHAYIDMLTLY